MRTRKLAISLIASLLAAATTALGSAHAAEPAEQTAAEVVEVVQALPDALVPAAGDVSLTSSGDLIANEEGASVTIPDSPVDGVQVVTAGGVNVEIGFPANVTSDASIADGVAVYTGEDSMDTSIAIQPTEDGGVQALVVIDSSEAPGQFSFPISTDQGSALTIGADGSAILSDGAGEFVGIFAAPWAFDANGASVPTRFSVVGGILTQIVDHDENFTYPVVADPRLYYSSQMALFNNYNAKCVSNKWSCSKVTLKVTATQTGWRSASCWMVGADVGGLGLGYERCDWERIVTAKVDLYSTTGKWLAGNTWFNLYVSERTSGGCFVGCWSAPEPKDSTAGVGWTQTYNWW